jgi:hypothetical protein
VRTPASIQGPPVRYILMLSERGVLSWAAVAIGAAGTCVLSSENVMTEEIPELPDRLSLDPSSPYFNKEILSRGVGIRFNGQEKTNVEEYCISEGWIRVEAGRSRDRYGKPMTIKVKGKVEPYFAGPPAGEEGVTSEG